MKQVIRAIVVSVATILATSASAVTLTDAEDTSWSSGGNITFEVLQVDGSINSQGNLGFGVYVVGSPVVTFVFSGGISVGDTQSFSSKLSGIGFAIRNSGTSFGGSYTRFSESSANANERDAMVAEEESAGVFLLKFEDLNNQTVDPGNPDLTVRITGLTPDNFTPTPVEPPAPIPLPAGGALLIGALGVLAATRRRVAR